MYTSVLDIILDNAIGMISLNEPDNFIKTGNEIFKCSSKMLTIIDNLFPPVAIDFFNQPQSEESIYIYYSYATYYPELVTSKK